MRQSGEKDQTGIQALSIANQLFEQSLRVGLVWHYWVGFGVLTATGISFGTIIPAATAITRWFSRYRGRMMSVTLSASGFAGFFVAPLINRILTANGGNWRQAWTIVVGISVLSAIVAFLFVRERPENLGQVVDGGPGAAPSASATTAAARVTKFRWEPEQAYRTRAYWMILAGAVACQFPFFFFTAHWLLHLKGVGVRPADAAFAMGLFTLRAVFGRLIGGWLMDAVEGRYAFMLGFCCYFLGSFLGCEFRRKRCGSPTAPRFCMERGSDGLSFA